MKKENNKVAEKLNKNGTGFEAPLQENAVKLKIIES